MTPQFSETQFAFSFLREYLNQYPYYPSKFWLYNFFDIPSTSAEIDTAADFIFRKYSHSVFFQFKRSHCMHWRGRGLLNLPEKHLSKTFFPYYRFKIYNSPNSRQFEKLRDITHLNQNDKAFYCAPLFHTPEEFRQHFRSQSILNNSVLIDCIQFQNSQFKKPYFDIRKDEPHYIVFNRSQGYIFSEPVDIKIQVGMTDTELARPVNNEIRFDRYVNQLFNWCFQAGTDKMEEGEYSILNSNDPYNSVFQFLLGNYNILWLPIFNLNNK